MSLVTCFVRPTEGVVREVNVEAQLGDWVPNVCYLFALDNRVGRYECRAYGVVAHVLCGLDEPTRYVVDVANILRSLWKD